MTIHQTDMQAASRPLSGKTALVTGSTSGIGLGVATALANAGANIVLNGFGDPTAIKALARGLGSASKVGVFYSGADLSRLQELEAMMAEATRRFGGVDILVNNAGIQHVAPVESFPVEKWDQILAINLSSAFHTARIALPHMRTKGWGRIINVASAHGLVASPFKSAYVAAKHGVIGLTKTIALEAAEAGVTCNAICPGYVYTPLVEAQIEGQAQSHGIPRDQVVRDVLLAQQPNKRFGTVEEIGAIALFLTSDGAASITGTALAADGGWTAH